MNQFDGCFTTFPKDQSLSNTHCIVIDGANKLVYDPAETKAITLIKDNLSRYCGDGANFRATTTPYGTVKSQLMNTITYDSNCY